VREVIIPANPRGTGRRWPKSPDRRAAKRRWVRELRARYGARWHAESGFSRHKRRLGSALTARRPASQQRQLVLRVLTHNLMLLARRAHKVSTEHECLRRAFRDLML
jgi:transposase